MIIMESNNSQLSLVPSIILIRTWKPHRNSSNTVDLVAHKNCENRDKLTFKKGQGCQLDISSSTIARTSLRLLLLLLQTALGKRVNPVNEGARRGHGQACPAHYSLLSEKFSHLLSPAVEIKLDTSLCTPLLLSTLPLHVQGAGRNLQEYHKGLPEARQGGNKVV